MARRQTSMLQTELDEMNLVQGIMTALKANGLAIARSTVFAGSVPITFVIALAEMVGPIEELMAEFDKAIKDTQLLEAAKNADQSAPSPGPSI